MGPFTMRLVTGFIAYLAFMARAAGGSTATSGSIGLLELRVVVTERPGIVRLRVLLPEDVPAGSIEVQVAERDVVVLARDTEGVQRRSRPLHVSQSVTEAGAQAQYEPDGSLIITLRGLPDGG